MRKQKIHIQFLVLTSLLGLILLSFTSCKIHTRKMKFQSFNVKLDSAYKSGYSYNNPVDVALYYVELAGEKNSCKIQTNKISASEVEVVIEHEFYDDDAASGDYFRICLSDKSGKWYITNAEHAWKCWNGRGHSDYSDVPCS